jgi:hypothetical protein
MRNNNPLDKLANLGDANVFSEVSALGMGRTAR